MVASTISNLQQALNCAGKCDCCDKLQAQINELKAEIARIPKVDEKRIIQQSIAGAELLILPAIAGIVLQQLAPISAAIAVIEAKLAAIAAQAAAAGTAAASAASTAGAALAKFAALAASIAAVLGVLATIKILGDRIDAVEGGLNALSNDLSRTLGLVLGIRNTAESADNKADRAIGVGQVAQKTADRAADIGQTAQKTASKAIDVSQIAQKTADRAIDVGQTAQGLATQAINEARNAISTANTATATASIASNKAEIAISEARNAISTANTATATANIASNKADIAIREARNAISTANTATATASIASNKADIAIREAKNAISTANTAINKAEQSQQSINGLSGKVSGIESEVDALAYAIPVLNNAVGNIGSVANTANSTANTALNESRSRPLSSQGLNVKGLEMSSLSKEFDRKFEDFKRLSTANAETRFNEFVAQNQQALNVKGLEMSSLSKEFDRKIEDFKRLSTADANTRFNEFVAQNQQALNIKGLEMSSLSKEFDRKIEDFKRLSTADANTRFNEFVEQNKRDLSTTDARVRALEQAIPKTENRVNTLAEAIPGIQAQQRENERLNKEGLKKLDQIIPALAGIPLIPALTASAIRPAIPTIPQISTAAATGVCQTTRPGGCLGNALNNQANNINNNIGNQLSNGFDKLNNAFSAGANAAQMVLLQKIDLKLGAQIAGGIGGKLTNMANWLQLDKVLNTLTFAATVHNAFLLSNDIGVTLGQSLSNILQIIGIKDDSGNAIDVGAVINSSVANLVKGIVGAEQYTQLSEAWAKANRIYQASNNVLNTFQNLTSTVLNGLELVAGQTGKIGNALRASGEVLESAYQWMNPQPKINRVTNFLEKLQNGASTIQQVTQAPLDVISAVTELQTANTEFIKAIKEDDKPENKGVTVEEPAKLALDKSTAKEASKGLELLGIDLEADD